MTEIQVMRNCSVPGQLYSIDVTSTNAGIPYADSFQIFTHFCLVRYAIQFNWISPDEISPQTEYFACFFFELCRAIDDHTMLSVYVQIKYTKSVWGVIKGFIEKNAWDGMENYYKDLLKALQSEYCIPPAKSKSRRKKRG